MRACAGVRLSGRMTYLNRGTHPQKAVSLPVPLALVRLHSHRRLSSRTAEVRQRVETVSTYPSRYVMESSYLERLALLLHSAHYPLVQLDRY